MVLTERTDNFVTVGATIEHHLVAVLEVNADSNVSASREYFDTKDIDRQLAATKIDTEPMSTEPEDTILG